jgi:hypothetical protein
VGSSRQQWGVQGSSREFKTEVGGFQDGVYEDGKRFYSRERRWMKGYLFKS